MLALNALISNLDVLMSQRLVSNAVRSAMVAKRLQKFLQPEWLPARARVADDGSYQRHLLYEDPAGRFCVGSFVWKPGQATPIHDHSCWCAFGVVQGRLVSDNFVIGRHGELCLTSSLDMPVGLTAWLSPSCGDIHRVANRARNTALSIHIYGAPFSEVCRVRYEEEAAKPLGFTAPRVEPGARLEARRA